MPTQFKNGPFSLTLHELEILEVKSIPEMSTVETAKRIKALLPRAANLPDVFLREIYDEIKSQ